MNDNKRNEYINALGQIREYDIKNKTELYEKVVEAIKYDYTLIAYLPDEIDNYTKFKIFFKLAIEHDIRALEYISEEDLNDLDFTMRMKFSYCAIESDVRALKYLYKNLNVLEYYLLSYHAVEKDAYAIKYVDETSEHYAEIAIHAVEKYEYAIGFVDKTSEHYVEIAEYAVDKCVEALIYVDETSEHYAEIAEYAVDKCADAIRYVDKTSEHYVEIAEYAVDKCAEALIYVNKTSEHYVEIAKYAVKKYADAIRYVNKTSEHYVEIAKHAVEKYPEALIYVDETLELYVEIAKYAVEKYAEALIYVDETSELYVELAKHAVDKCVEALIYVDETSEHYAEIAIYALKNTFFSMKYISVDIPIPCFFEILVAAIYIQNSYYERVFENYERIFPNNLDYICSNKAIKQHLSRIFGRKANDNELKKYFVLTFPNQVFPYIDFEKDEIKKMRNEILLFNKQAKRIIVDEARGMYKHLSIINRMKLGYFHEPNWEGIKESIGFDGTFLLDILEKSMEIKGVRESSIDYEYTRTSHNQESSQKDSDGINPNNMQLENNTDDKKIKERDDTLSKTGKITDRSDVLKKLRENAGSFKNLDLKWRKDKDIALEAIIIDGLLLEYVSEELKSDEDIVKAALKSNPMALKFAGNKFKDNNKVVLDCVERCGLALEFASPRLRDDDKIVKSAVSQNAFAVLHALYIDKEIALEVVTKNGLLLKFLSDFKGDKDVVLIAVKQNRLAIKYASKELYGDSDVMLSAIIQKYDAFCLYLMTKIVDNLKEDDDFFKKIYEFNFELLKYANPSVSDKIRFEKLKELANNILTPTQIEIEDSRKKIN